MKNFLFDLYGTLVDIETDEQSREFKRGLAEITGADGDDVLSRYLALCKQADGGEGREFDLLPVFARLSKEFCPNVPAEQFALRFRKASTKKLRLYEGAAELVNGLKERGARAYLLSNAQACFTRAELKFLGLYNLFDGISLSSEVGYKKPAPQFFCAAFEKFGLEAAQCVYVGNDLGDDVEGARGVGMRSVYIETEQSRKYTENIRPDMTAASRKELAEMLFNMAEM